jgi:hypothetical protein
MLTTSHAIWSFIIFSRLVKTKTEKLSIALASIIPDMEIIFWLSLFLLNKAFAINPFNLDYRELLRGSGISFYYWPLTLLTNSFVSIVVINLLLLVIFKKKRIILILGLVVAFHAVCDAFTHKAGNMLLWPLSFKKYFGLFEYQALPLSVLLLEQAFSFFMLFLFLKKNTATTHYAKQS